MKSKTEIKLRIGFFEQKLKTELDLYKEMHQIDMQSGDGNTCRKFINETKGQIKALKWILE